MPGVVSNASPLIYAAKVGFLRFLKELYGSVTLPPTVYEEAVQRGLERGAPDALALDGAAKEGWLKIAELGNEVRTRMEVLLKVPGLSRGEAEVIALAKCEDMTALVDERVGRAVARAWGVEAVGLLGAIIEAMARGLLDFDRLRELFDRLARTEFRLSYKDYERAFTLAEKVWRSLKAE